MCVVICVVVHPVINKCLNTQKALRCAPSEQRLSLYLLMDIVNVAICIQFKDE